MYDKYNKVLPIIVNQVLPSNKGLLLSSKTDTDVTVEYYGGGLTGSHVGVISIISKEDRIIPIQVRRVTSLGGSTGFLLN